MCNCNNTITTTQNHVCKPKCPPQEDCTCPVRLSSECITYNGNDLECSGIESGLPLNQTIELLDNYICEAIDEISTAINLVNVGEGEDIYAGIDGIGRRKIKRVNTDSNILTITPNTDDITFGIDEEALDTFIEENQKTYSVANVGTGAGVYKDSTVVGGNVQFNFRTVVKEDLGLGVSFLRDIQQTTDELKVRVKTLVSDNLTITATDEEVRIETPMTASIPALYVNDLYQPTYQEWLSENSSQNGGVPVIGFEFIGRGTLASPFTNTFVYTLGVPATPPTITANSAIQNALDGDTAYSYVGNLTRLNPQRKGQEIIVQNNNGYYEFAGDFNYENLKLRLEGTIVATTTGYLVDMDNPSYFDAMNGRFLITIEANQNLQLIDSLGFRNSGNTSFAPPMYDSGRIGAIYGEGTVYASYNGVDILNRYIFNGDGNNNDGQVHFMIKAAVRADNQGVYFTKNLMRIDFYNIVQSGTLLGSGDINLKALHMTGGQIRFYEKGSIYLGNEVTGRIHGVTFEPEDDGIGHTRFQLNSAKVAGNSKYCFAKLNNESVQFLAFNSPSGDGFATVIPGTSTITNGLFENLGVTKWNVDFKNNVFSYTGIDHTKVDLTGGNSYSAINFIGNEILENLVVFPNKSSAILAGHPINSAFIKRTVFNAVDLLAGVEYKVVTSGSPSLGAIGDFFTATGSETGTGRASLETREILT